MKVNWQFKTIAECAADEPYSTQIGPFGEKIRADIYTPKGAPVLRGTNVNPEGRFHDDDFVFIDTELAEREFSKFVCEADDVILCHKGTLGKIGIIPKRSRFKKYIMGNSMMKVRCDQAKLNPLYLYYWLCSRDGQEYLYSRVSQVGVPQIQRPLSTLRQCPLPIPPITEQRAIASVLGTLDDKIELNRRMNETLEALAQTLFKSWFVDATQSPLPKGWRVSSLPEEIDFLEGPGLRNWQYRDEGMKFLNIRCINDGDLDTAKANAISMEEFEKTYSHFALREDDIVISTSGTLGRLAIVRADHLPVMLNTSIIRMRGRGPVGLAYLWGFLQSEYFLEEMFAAASGSVQLNFGPIHLKKISMLRPPDELLKRFEEVAQPLLRKALHNRHESRTLAALRDALLPKLLSGELRVPHASGVA